MMRLIDHPTTHTKAPSMKTPAKKPAAKTKALPLCALAATILGRLRSNGLPDLSTAQLAIAFPAFNSLEMAHALQELLEKELLTQKGQPAHHTYTLTDYGRQARITVD
jgi:hypothetical protein